MKNLVYTLLLGLFITGLVSSLSIEKRREKVYAKSQRLRKEEKKDEVKPEGELLVGGRAKAIPIVPYTLEQVGVDVSASLKGLRLSKGNVRFFSLVPLRLARRPMAKFLVLINIRLVIVDCSTNFDPRLCAQNCAKVGFELDQRCMDCDKPENKNDAFCYKQEKKKFCVNANKNPNYVFNKEDDCCEFAFKECAVLHSDKIINGCCEDPKYKNEYQCSCQYVLENIKLFSKEKTSACCEEVKNMNGGVPDKRCGPNGPEVCKADIEPCCADAFVNIKEQKELFKECCKTMPGKECTCKWKMENQMYFAPSALKEECCKGDDFAEKELCMDCAKKFKPVQKCCQDFISNGLVDPAKTKQCCQTIPEYKNLEVCLEKCTPENCGLEHCKTLDMCVCQELIKKTPLDMEDQQVKKCFCQLHPKDRQCIDCTKDDTQLECCEPYLENPLTDYTAYKKCCALYDTHANCKCATIIATPTNFKPDQTKQCCKSNTVVPDCCDVIRNKDNLLDFSKAQQEECCKPEYFKKLSADDSGREVCCDLKPNMEGCTTPKICDLGEEISPSCCEHYKKSPAQFSNGLKGCCDAKLLDKKDCCCKNIITNEKSYGGISSSMVKECCKNVKYKDVDVCDKCKMTPTPDDKFCCKQIVAGDMKNFKSFTSCCLQEEFKNHASCKVDCAVEKENPQCCPGYLADPKNNEKDYARCCALPEFMSRSECNCVNILADVEAYPKSQVCDNCYKKLPKNQEASQAVKELCDKCEDCDSKPEQECCKPDKCDEIFKNPFSNLATFDECCKNAPARVECQCPAILKLLPGAKGQGYDMATQKSATMNNCCNQVQAQSDSAYGLNLGCDNCPTNEMCCANFLKDIKAYKSKFESVNPTAFKQFESSCCSKDPKWKENNCPEPVCSETPFKDVRCCDSLTVDSPNDQNMKSCCGNKSWSDKKGVCPCEERDSNDKYPRCCKTNYDNEACCIHHSEYASNYGAKCCEKQFDTAYCCNDYSVLDKTQQVQCCNKNYVGERCCDLSWRDAECCKLKTGEIANKLENCCKLGVNNFSNDLFKDKCCDESSKQFNPTRFKDCSKKPDPLIIPTPEPKPVPKPCPGYEDADPVLREPDCPRKPCKGFEHVPEAQQKFPPCENTPCPNQEGVAKKDLLYSPDCKNIPCKGYEDMELSKQLFPPNCPEPCANQEDKPENKKLYPPNCGTPNEPCPGYENKPFAEQIFKPHCPGNPVCKQDKDKPKNEQRHHPYCPGNVVCPGYENKNPKIYIPNCPHIPNVPCKGYEDKPLDQQLFHPYCDPKPSPNDPCKGYEKFPKEKQLFQPNCPPIPNLPCPGQEGKPRHQWIYYPDCPNPPCSGFEWKPEEEKLYPPNCPPAPVPINKLCKNSKIYYKPNCPPPPCPHQEGVAEKDLVYEPNCHPVNEHCKGYPDVYPPCPTIPNHPCKNHPTLYPPNCPDVPNTPCKGYENADPKIYMPNCPSPPNNVHCVGHPDLYEPNCPEIPNEVCPGYENKEPKLYHPNCNKKYCVGYEIEKLQMPCPCTGQQDKDQADRLFPPKCPTGPKEYCVGYEKEKLVAPCPCKNQEEMEKDKRLFPPNCKDIPEEYCAGFEKEGLQAPCPCPESAGMQKDQYVFPPKCKEQPPVYCVGYSDEKLVAPCPCPDQQKVAKGDRKFPPNCPLPPPLDYCVGYEAEELVPPCPCMGEQKVLKDKRNFPPNCPLPPPKVCVGYEGVTPAVMGPKCPCEKDAKKAPADRRFPPDCAPENLYCKGYEELKIKVCKKKPCPCPHQQEIPKSKWIYPPSCPVPPTPVPEKKLCKGYEQMEIYTPKCPCCNQEGVAKDDLLYHPHCPPNDKKHEWCLGYTDEIKFDESKACPCQGQEVLEDLSKMVYPPKCNEPHPPPTPPVDPKEYCIGYKEMGIMLPNCPCGNQKGVAKENLLYPPDCPNPPPHYCPGYEKEEILTPKCPCPDQEKVAPADRKYPPKCTVPDPGPGPSPKVPCKGYENADPVLYAPCPCPDQQDKTPKLYHPNCEGEDPKPPVYCYGYEELEILVSDGCPCPNQQKVEKSKWLFPENCPLPDDGPEDKFCEGYEHMDVQTNPCPCPDQKDVDIKDLKYPPNCKKDPVIHDEKYCQGYKKEKILLEDGCPCDKQQGKEPKDMKYPPHCGPDIPYIKKQYCNGYEEQKIEKPKCPCENQQGKKIEEMIFPPDCDIPIPKFCEGWEKQKIYPPCPCKNPTQSPDTPKESLLFPPNCQEVCVGYEDKEEKIYVPHCPKPDPKKVCEEYKDAEEKHYEPDCPCPGQVGKKEGLLFYPNCEQPEYCPTYESEKIVAPCPCPHQQGKKNKRYAPCGYPDPGPQCQDNVNKCNCAHGDDYLNIQKYFRCACLNNKQWSRKMCLCAEKPDHKDCECLPKNVALQPSLKTKCCKKNADKQYCECQDLYERYSGPTSLSMVMAEDKSLYKTCCTKFFKCGFCYDGPTPPADDKCPAVLKVAEKEDKKFRSCCAEHMILQNSLPKPNRDDANTVKCCENFKCTFKTNALCLPPPPVPECDIEKDINNPESPKHAKCCADPDYKSLPGCAKCNAKVFSDVNDPNHTECCKEDSSKCCTQEIFKDPAHQDYKMCCDLPENAGQCCKSGWKDISALDHKVCCEKNQAECCNKDVYWNPKHPDHKVCCAADKKQCEPNPAPCESKEKYDPKSDTYAKCCIDHFVAEWCKIPDCKKDVFPFPAKKKSHDWVICCAKNPDHEECDSQECKEVFALGDSKSSAYIECCKAQPGICPDPFPECYPKTVFTDPNDEKHSKCCKLQPQQPGCDVNKKCSNEVFQNVQHPDYEYCCEQDEYRDKLECNKPIPCITECAEDNEVVEEFFNKEGFVTMKGRMKKKLSAFKNKKALHHKKN